MKQLVGKKNESLFNWSDELPFGGGKELLNRQPHLTGAHLTGVHLTGAHLTGAHLTGAHLTKRFYLCNMDAFDGGRFCLCNMGAFNWGAFVS